MNSEEYKTNRMERKYFTEKKFLIIFVCMAVLLLIVAAIFPMYFPSDFAWVDFVAYVLPALMSLVLVIMLGFYPVIGSRSLTLRHILFHFMDKDYRFCDICHAAAYSENYGCRITIKMKDGRVMSKFIRTSRTQLDELNKELSAHIQPEEQKVAVSEKVVRKDTSMTSFKEKKYVSWFPIFYLPAFCFVLAIACGIGTYVQGCFEWWLVLATVLFACLMMLFSNYVLLTGKQLMFENFFFRSRIIIFRLEDIESVRFEQDKAFYLATVVLKPKNPGSAQVEHKKYLAISSRLLDELRCDLTERGVVVQ